MAAFNLSHTNIYILSTYIIWLILFVSTSIPLVIWHHKSSEELARVGAEYSGNIIDSLSNVALVHAFGGVSHEESQNQLWLSKVLVHERKVRWIFLLNKLQCGISVVLLGVSVIYACVWLFSKGQLSVGEFILVSATLPTLNGVIWNLGETVVRLSRKHAELANALESLRRDDAHLTGGEVTSYTYPSYGIELKNIFFQYPGTTNPVFNGLSMMINPGEKVGIVGSSGAGKSTLVKLLLRHHEFGGGNIAIAGVPIREYSLQAFHKLISYVPQDTVLFHRTLFENIKYAKADAADSEIFESSKHAKADEFIQTFPAGYETLVGERGVKLSGGQRQRIALARAILKNAPILILDEATSSLDSESESSIQQALSELFQGRTVIAIAHRLSTLRAMDRIIVMRDGKIVEDGSPHDLLADKEGAFKKMWDSQKNGFIE